MARESWTGAGALAAGASGVEADPRLTQRGRARTRERVARNRDRLLGRTTSARGRTPARSEREVGLLLLKGLSLKDIAVVRGASEATVRQQAQAIYRKADLAGRAELSAFFLEDLLLPRNEAARTPAPTRSRAEGA
jgi:DNA-binding NarL/FixJ family response regulator